MSRYTEPLIGSAWPRQENAGLDTEIGQLGVLTEAVVHSAQVEVCSRAADVAEARVLLLMLGIGGAA